MINNYEEEIVHDILYEARNKGHITDLRIFEMAFPMVMGFQKRNQSNNFYVRDITTYTILY